VGTLLVILGAVALIEGLVLALAPLRMEQLLAFLASLDEGQKRSLGLGFAALGVALVWIGQGLGG